MPPEPFGYLPDEDRQQAIELARHIARMDWVLFVGSGVSRPSGLPLWRELTDKMLHRLDSGNETRDPLETAFLFDVNLGRNALVEFLQESLTTLGFKPNVLHDRLLALCPPVVVTTNFDDLLERAFDQKNLRCAPVVTNQDLSLTAGRVQILKVHGDLRQPDSLVISSRDYERYPQQKQELINNKLRSLAAEHSFLFVGYSVSDPDLNQQFRKVLDAQGELARHHYLIVDRISPQWRHALLERHIHSIAIGSYDQLESFLEHVRTEAEKHRPQPETAAQPMYTTKSLELLELGAADRHLLTFLQEDYTPVIEAFQHLRFTDAEHHLEHLLKRIQHIAEEEPALAETPKFRDFHQRLFLALATVATRRGNPEEARAFFCQAESLKSFEGRRRLQAAEVLMSLGEFDQAEALVDGSPEASEDRGKEILGLAALFRNDEQRFRVLYPSGAEGNLEFAIQRARLSIEAATDATAEEALGLLDKAWNLSQDFPTGLLMIAELTDAMFRRILFEEWDVVGVDRQELLGTIRMRYREARQCFEGLSDQYREGLKEILQQLLAFHHFLGEEEEQEALLTQLQFLSGVTREQVMVEPFIGHSVATLAKLQESHLTLEQEALLRGAVLIREGKALEAERLYRKTISKPVISGQRRSVIDYQLIEALLKLLLEQERFEEAFACIEELTLPGDVFREEMRGMVFLHRKNRGEAIAVLRSALKYSPKNILLLENLTRLLASQQEADRATSSTKTADSNQSHDLTEALQYAERLEALLPSFEHVLLRADLLRQLGRDEEALRLVDAVEKDGYITLQMLKLKFGLLQALDKHREAAEFLTAYTHRYPTNYSLRFNEAAAWAKMGEINQAVTIWEELRHQPEADANLYLNLVLAYIQGGALDPSSFSKAFDIAKAALEKFPDRRELAPLLLEAALGSGRNREAWDIIGQRPDLQRGPYLQAVPGDEGLRLLSQEMQAIQAREAHYRAGAIPFATYARHSPRSAVFLWQARLYVWRQGNRGALHLSNLPTIALEPKRLEIPSTGIVIDMTALLTLSSLHGTREVLNLFNQVGRTVFLFPGTRRWLEEELARLSFDQLPAYRERWKRLHDQLRSARERVELSTIVNEPKPLLNEPIRQQLGIYAWDIERAMGENILYVDDYLPLENKQGLPPGTVITSADLLAALEAAGVLFPEDAEQIRTKHPEPFASRKTGITIPLDRPVMFSVPALLAWSDAGLLDRWFSSQSGWPPRVVVGPVAWQDIGKEVAEGEIYREALQLATDLRAAINEALEHGYVKELETIDQSTIDGNRGLGDLLAPSLMLLERARACGLAVWTDDLCTRLLVDSRGPLIQDPVAVDMARRARCTYMDVPIGGTDDVLYWLESTGQLSRERRNSIIWQLHRDGYRFLDLGEVLVWLLERFRYNHKAVMVRELLRDLEMVSTLTLPHVDPNRLRLFIDFYVGEVLSHTVSDLWRAEDPLLSSEMRKALSTELVDLFEGITLQ